MENEFDAPDLYDRTFGHYNIIWKIENFRIASCEENWRLQSPVIRISGHQLTRWVMILSPKVKRNKRYAVLSLRRLKTDKGPEVVWVQWRSWLKLMENNNENEYYLSEYDHRFRKGEVFASDYILLNQLYFYVKPFIHDVFKIRCVFVFQPEYMDVPSTNVSVGVESLSEDLSKLFDCGMNYNIELKTNIMNIRAHKEILHYRNRVFAEKIENDCQDGTIDLSQVEHEALNNIIYYLYTGNLEFILQRPTLQIEELALDYDIDEIKNCYVLNTLYLESKYDIDEFTFVWRIPEYSMGNPLYHASRTVRGRLNFFWRLYIFPNSLDTENAEYVPIMFSYVRGQKPQSLCIELSVLNDRNQCVHSKRKCKKLESGIGFEKFMKKDDLRAALVDDILKIRLRVIVSPSSLWSSSEWYDNDLRPRARLDPYTKLSSDLACMLTEGKFGNITIQVEGQSYKAHTSLLCVRSSVLTKMLRNDNVTIPDMESRIFQILLYYMYTGVFKDYDFNDIYKIYDYAVAYDISALPSICSNILRENLKVQSVVDILAFSAEKNDTALKQSAIDFISQNRNEVFQDDSWQDLMKVKPYLCLEVTTYMKNKNKKYITYKKKFLLRFRKK